MKPTEFDISVIDTVKAIRMLRGEKQNNLAAVLNLNQSQYCRIEAYERAISIGQLNMIADYLKVSIFAILSIAKEKTAIQNNTPLSAIIIKFIKMFEGDTSQPNLSEEEMIYVVSKIQDYYKRQKR